MRWLVKPVRLQQEIWAVVLWCRFVRSSVRYFHVAIIEILTTAYRTYICTDR